MHGAIAGGRCHALAVLTGRACQDLSALVAQRNAQPIQRQQNLLCLRLAVLSTYTDTILHMPWLLEDLPLDSLQIVKQCEGNYASDSSRSIYPLPCLLPGHFFFHRVAGREKKGRA